MSFLPKIRLFGKILKKTFPLTMLVNIKIYFENFAENHQIFHQKAHSATTLSASFRLILMKIYKNKKTPFASKIASKGNQGVFFNATLCFYKIILAKDLIMSKIGNGKEFRKLRGKIGSYPQKRGPPTPEVGVGGG